MTDRKETQLGHIHRYLQGTRSKGNGCVRNKNRGGTSDATTTPSLIVVVVVVVIVVVVVVHSMENDQFYDKF